MSIKSGESVILNDCLDCFECKAQSGLIMTVYRRDRYIFWLGELFGDNSCEWCEGSAKELDTKYMLVHFIWVLRCGSIFSERAFHLGSQGIYLCTLTFVAVPQVLR